VGLSIDSSPWVKANLITQNDMLDRNWAHWTTFSMVQSLHLKEHSSLALLTTFPSGCVLVSLCWPRILRIVACGTSNYSSPFCGHGL
jgi:hypothetical protein